MAESKTTKKNVTTKKKECLELCWEPRAFDAFGKTTRINSKDLATMIREQFQQSFHECVGCYIGYTKTFEVTLFFEKNSAPCPDDKITNLIDFTDSKSINKNSLLEGMQYLNNKTSGRTYDLNKDTKELLSKYMYGGREAKRDWKQLVCERRVPAPSPIFGPKSERILVAVTGFDLMMLIHELYGDKMITGTIEENGKVMNVQASAKYFARYMKMLPDGSFTINIEQFDVDKVSELAKKENPMVAHTGGVIMY